MVDQISELYEMQKVLDAKIIKEKGLTGDLLPNTVLALQVEICELANEWRGFKHWSNDQFPRNHVLTIGDNCGEETITNPMLEEYVDCLHFLLSIANQLGLPEDDLYVAEDSLEGETSIIFTDLLHNVGLINAQHFLMDKPKDLKKWQRDHLRGSLFIFYNLGTNTFGFTFEEIADAYMKKNQINHLRQANGY